MTAETYKGIPFDNILKCVHCGLCLDACPTYRVLGTEQDSPRGRLYLMRGLWEGEIEIHDEVVEPLSRCLDCRACETACPSLVPYGELLEKTRGVLARPSMRKTLGAQFRSRLLLVFSSTRKLTLISFLARLYQRSGLAALGTRILPPGLARAHDLMPNFSGRSFKRLQPERVPSRDGTGPKGKVSLFTGCVMDVAEHEIHRSTLVLLLAAGFDVQIPWGQVCCGALHVHNGDRDTARDLARINQRAFPDKETTIIVNAAGCGAQLKEYHHLFSDTGNPDEKHWQGFGARVADVMDFLAVQKGFPESLSWIDEPVTVFYDAPCHLIHAQKIDAGPRDLLGRIPGVALVPLKDASYCCGAAGIYNLVHGKLAGKILDAKLDDLEAMLNVHPSGRVLLTGNPGCLFQLRMGVRRWGLPISVMHPAVFLAQRLGRV